MTPNTQSSPEDTPAWRHLAAHAAHLSGVSLSGLVTDRGASGERFCVRVGPLLADFTRQHVDPTALDLLLTFAAERGLRAAITAMLDGAAINRSEERPALHAALRDSAGRTAQARVAAGERERMLAFAEAFAAGQVSGADGPLDTLVNIGIGGSDLGPRLVCDALHERARTGVRVEFVSNLDGQALHRVLRGVDPARALFVVASKSFGTVETMANAASARRWLESAGCSRAADHFAAVTANTAAARSLGIPPGRIFNMWDWVGGRYSVWSSVGLPVAVGLGAEAFLEFLDGARRMDSHLDSAEDSTNLPVLLGLLDLWNASFLGAQTRAIVPYDQRLRLLPDYLSQLVMESNGKSVHQDGTPVSTMTSPILWGGVGTDAQHAFFQLLHQGTHRVPVEFLIAARAEHFPDHHALLLAACLAQGQALMSGRDDPEHPWRSTRGNQPSTTLIYDELTPETLGMLIALYEHRTFVHATLLDINPFDQWGVELGKEIARGIAADVERGSGTSADETSLRLLRHCLGR